MFDVLRFCGRLVRDALRQVQFSVLSAAWQQLRRHVSGKRHDSENSRKTDSYDGLLIKK